MASREEMRSSSSDDPLTQNLCADINRDPINLHDPDGQHVAGRQVLPTDGRVLERRAGPRDRSAPVGSKERRPAPREAADPEPGCESRPVAHPPRAGERNQPRRPNSHRARSTACATWAGPEECCARQARGDQPRGPHRHGRGSPGGTPMGTPRGRGDPSRLSVIPARACSRRGIVRSDEPVRGPKRFGWLARSADVVPPRSSDRARADAAWTAPRVSERRGGRRRTAPWVTIGRGNCRPQPRCGAKRFCQSPRWRAAGTHGSSLRGSRTQLGIPPGPRATRHGRDLARGDQPPGPPWHRAWSAALGTRAGMMR